jgi:hypothetical protein
MAAQRSSAKTKKAATKSKVSSKTKKVPASSAVSERPRMLKAPVYKTFRLHKRIKAPQKPLPKVRALLGKTWKVMAGRPKLFGGIALVYLLLTFVLVRGLNSGLDLAGTKDVLNQLYFGVSGKALTTASLFGILLDGSGSNANPNAGTYQSLIAVITALAVIWAARQHGSKVAIRVRDAFYRGMYPIVPFVLLLFVISLQLIPAAIGGWIYSVVITGGLAVSVLEKTLWILLVSLALILSLYMLTSSVFALIIVTLPDMTPMRALRSARHLVLHRRWKVASKFVGMLITLLVVGLLIMAPFLLWLPNVAEAIFVILSAFGVVIPIVYMYNLYLGLLE